MELNRPICLTNGCFAELETWHKNYLKDAAKYGNLIVLMNSNRSIEKLKHYKNLKPQEERAKDLLALPYVKGVIIFDDMSPMYYLNKIKPDIYIKGGDYNLNTMNQLERKILEKNGSKIIFTNEYKKDQGHYVKKGYTGRID